MGVRGGAATPLWVTNYTEHRRPRGGGDSYGNPDGRRLPNPALAWAVVPSRGISLETQIRFNNGPHRTAHNGTHQNLWDNFYGLPPQNGYSMCAVR